MIPQTLQFFIGAEILILINVINVSVIYYTSLSEPVSDALQDIHSNFTLILPSNLISTYRCSFHPCTHDDAARHII